MSYDAAVTNNTGWRHATNSEVENIFGQLFEGFAPNSGSGISVDYPNSGRNYGYDGQLEQVTSFIDLFGTTYTNEYNYGEYGYGYAQNYSYGWYADEDDILRGAGAYNLDYNGNSYYDIYDVNVVYTPDYNRNFEQFRSYELSTGLEYGSFLVRNTENLESVTSVPEPSSLAIMCLGLLGLIRFSCHNTKSSTQDRGVPIL